MAHWTPEQQAAIDARGASFLVAAAAGSGKTSVLVERLIQLLADEENPISVSRLAVVTFTNDAAAEMKGRLNKALSARIAADPANSWLRQQHGMLQCAKISTIHSFCYDLIRDNCQTLDITPNFRILEETEELLLRNAALDTVLEQWYADSARTADLQLLCDSLCGKTDEQLEALLLAMYNRVMGMPFGFQRLTGLIRGDSDGTLRARYLSRLADRCNRAVALLEDALEAAADVAQPKLTELLHAELTQAEVLAAALLDPAQTPAQLADLCAAIVFTRIPSLSAKCPDPAQRELAACLRGEAKGLMVALRDEETTLLRHMDEDLAAHATLLPLLQELLEAFSAELWRRKCEKNAIGFDDGEQVALSLLADCDDDGVITRTPLAEQLSEYYQMLLLDEFQDTNNRQDLIFKLLSHGGSATRNGDNLFMVGDIKQAIYRFRLANPQNFLDTMAASVPYSPTSSGNAFLRLNRNFRSSAEVVDTVNFLFATLMSPEVGEVRYDAGEALVQGAAFADTPRDTEVVVLPANGVSTADYVAARIAQMLRDGHPVSVDAVHTRPCTPRDFCILTQKRAPAAAYVAALEARGIAVYCEEEAAYLQSFEIAVLLNLLRLIDSPPNDLAMASVLLSPMFCFTADELTQLRLLSPKSSLYDAICRGLGCRVESRPEEPLLCGALLEKTEYFYRTLAALRRSAMSDPLEQLIRRIYDSTDYLAVMKQGKNGARRRANLRMLLTHARTYETNMNGGISGFLRYLDRVFACGKDMQRGAVVSGSEDVVAIKTIHKSKGLEFPFVFLAESQTPFSTKEQSAPYQFSQADGFGLRLQDAQAYTRYVSMPYATIRAQNNTLAKSEQLRLLYVALTRAKDKLFLPLPIFRGTEKSVRSFATRISAYGGVSPMLASEAGSLADWLWMGLLTASNAEPLRAGMNTADCACAGSVPVQFFFGYPLDTALPEPVESSVAGAMPDSALTALLQARFAAAEAEVPSTLAAKTTVSMLAHADDAIELALRRPRFLEAAGKLTAAERGTALHTFLQFADFSAAVENPAGELERLVQNGFLTRPQAAAIRLPQLEQFFASALYRRICDAKRVERERRFLVRLGDLNLPQTLQYEGTDAMLSGIMDLVLEEDDGLVLVDYKTDAVSEREAALLEERHRAQLQLYRRTLERMTGKQVKETCLFAFALGRVIPVSTEE